MLKIWNVEPTGVLGALVALIGIMGASARASSVPTDFTTQGAGGWSYGYYSSGTLPLSPSNFVAFPNERNVPGYTQLQEWYTDNTTDPNVIYNSGASTGSIAAYGYEDFVSGTVDMGPTNFPAVVRYTVPDTAPLSGTYDISSTFTTVQYVNALPTAYLYLGSSLFGSKQLTAGGITQSDPISNTPSTIDDPDVTLTRGETVDFVVWGGSGNFKTTQLQATVSLVPLPMEVTGGAMLLCGIAGFRRMRQSHLA